MRWLHQETGVSLVEGVGMAAILAVGAALAIPQVYDVIKDSQAEALAATVKTYELAIQKYYADMGTILPIDAQGNPQPEASGESAVPQSLPARLTLIATDPQVGSANQWANFRGPYLEKFRSHRPPVIGDHMALPIVQAVPLGTTVTARDNGWDVKGDDGRSDLPSGSMVVLFRLTGVSRDLFLRFDQVTEPDIGDTDDERAIRGRAKYDEAHSTLRLYLAHQ